MRVRTIRRLALVLTTATAALTIGGPGATAGSVPVIDTVAGGVPHGLPGTEVSVKATSVAKAPDGGLYINDAGSGLVWHQAADGTLTRFAGRGLMCPPNPRDCDNEGGSALDAELTTLSGIAVDEAGNVYVSEQRAHRVRRIDAVTRRITTVAGTGESGYRAGDDGGPARQAQLYGPGTLAFDHDGNLLIAEVWGRRIRKVDAAGIITTLAGCGSYSYPVCSSWAKDGSPVEGTPIGANAGINGNGWGIAVHPLTGRLYIADAGQVLRLEPDGVYRRILGEGFQYAAFPGEGEGGPAKDARISVAVALAFADDGTLYVMEGGGSYVNPWNRVQKVEAPAEPTSIFRHVGGTGIGKGYSGDGGPATKALFSFSQPGSWVGQGMAVDSAKNVYVTDVRNERLRRIEDGTTKRVFTHAGNGYGSMMGSFYAPEDFSSWYGDLSMTARGGLSGDGRQATTAQLAQPYDVEADHLGNLYVLDRANLRVRRVAKDGTITNVAGSGCVGEDCWAEWQSAPLGDGGPATKASLMGASGITLDRTGTQLYIVDEYHARVRQVNLGTSEFVAYPLGTQPVTIKPGHIETIFGPGVSANFPGVPFIANYSGCALLKPYCGEGLPAQYQSTNTMGDVAADTAGNLYVADAYIGAVYKVEATTGTVLTLVGTNNRTNCTSDAHSGLPGRATQLCAPTSLQTSPDGRWLYIAETGGMMGWGESLAYGWVGSTPESQSRIRKVDLRDPLATSWVVAGKGNVGLSGDGGPSTEAQIAYPHGMDVAQDGTLYFADTGNHRVRKVSPDGKISTVAGNGEYLGQRQFVGCGFSGDGGPASGAQLCAPIGLTVAPDGTLYIADSLNNRVRAVKGL